MTDIQTYPMALYHPKTGKMKLVADEQEHMEILSDWEGENPPELVKNKGGRPRKNP
jgi:hypothetical protein